MSQEPEPEETRPLQTPPVTTNARPRPQRRKHFWPLMVAVVIVSGFMALGIAHWGYRGQSRVLVAAIWYALVLIGYRLLTDTE